MDVLAVIGSKRREGNTAVLVSEVIRGLQSEGHECATVFLDDHDIAGCSGCEACSVTGRCVVEDGMQDIYPLVEKADALVLGSPTYFYALTADMKAFIERMYCFLRFHPEDRSAWTNVNELQGIKHAVTVTVCEQHSQDDMGYTPEIMRRSLTSLGYRVVNEVRALGLFSEGEAMRDAAALDRAFLAGTRLGKVLELRSL